MINSMLGTRYRFWGRWWQRRGSSLKHWLRYLYKRGCWRALLAKAMFARW